MSMPVIDSREKIFNSEFKLAPYPTVYPETARKLSDIYLNSRKWSYYGPSEKQFAEEFPCRNLKYAVR